MGGGAYSELFGNSFMHHFYLGLVVPRLRTNCHLEYKNSKHRKSKKKNTGFEMSCILRKTLKSSFASGLIVKQKKDTPR